MYISHKTNVLQTIHETEWQCRRLVKGQNKSEYWTWLDSITSGDPPVVDLSGETGYVIIECTDEDVQARLSQLGDYTSIDGIYNIKYYTAKRDAEIVDVLEHTIAAHIDEDGNDVAEEDVATTYVQTHFIGQNDTKDARLLAEEWTRIRAERDRLLTSSDWTQANDTPLGVSKKTEWTTYRQDLRDIPEDQTAKTTYEDITWPSQPS